MPGIQRSPAASCEQTRGGGAMPWEPTVPRGTQETVSFFGGSQKKDMWAVAKVTIAPHHPWK